MNNFVLSVILLFGSLTLLYHNGHRLDTCIKTCFRTSSGNKFPNLASPFKRRITLAMHALNISQFKHIPSQAKNEARQKTYFAKEQKSALFPTTNSPNLASLLSMMQHHPSSLPRNAFHLCYYHTLLPVAADCQWSLLRVDSTKRPRPLLLDSIR